MLFFNIIESLDVFVFSSVLIKLLDEILNLLAPLIVTLVVINFPNRIIFYINDIVVWWRILVFDEIISIVELILDKV